MDKCPMCGYVAPAQNSFKPNVMSEYYIPKTKEVVVLNDNAEELDHPVKGKMIRKDVYKARQSNVPTPVSTVPPPPSTIRSTPTPAPVKPSVPVVTKPVTPSPVKPAQVVTPTIIPARPIPESAIKTPEEVAATPASAVTATPVVETPLVANIIPTSEGQP